MRISAALTVPPPASSSLPAEIEIPRHRTATAKPNRPGFRPRATRSAAASPSAKSAASRGLPRSPPTRSIQANVTGPEATHAAKATDAPTPSRSSAALRATRSARTWSSPRTRSRMTRACAAAEAAQPPTGGSPSTAKRRRSTAMPNATARSPRSRTFMQSEVSVAPMPPVRAKERAPSNAAVPCPAAARSKASPSTPYRSAWVSATQGPICTPHSLPGPMPQATSSAGRSSEAAPSAAGEASRSSNAAAATRGNPTVTPDRSSAAVAALEPANERRRRAFAPPFIGLHRKRRSAMPRRAVEFLPRLPPRERDRSRRGRVAPRRLGRPRRRPPRKRNAALGGARDGSAPRGRARLP